MGAVVAAVAASAGPRQNLGNRSQSRRYGQPSRQFTRMTKPPLPPKPVPSGPDAAEGGKARVSPIKQKTHQPTGQCGMALLDYATFPETPRGRSCTQSLKIVVRKSKSAKVTC